MPQFEKLIRDLSKSIKESTDKRLHILLLHLYAEHYINLLCKNNHISVSKSCSCCSDCSDKRQLSFNEKIESLIKEEILDENLLKPFKLLNQIRNKMVHYISPDNKKIKKWILEFSPDTSKEVLYLFTAPSEKFLISVIAAIAHVYKKISNENIDIAIIKDEDTKKWSVDINNIEICL